MATLDIPQKILFVHLDDEAARIAWIPRAIRTSFYGLLPDGLKAGGPIRKSADGKTFDFALVAGERRTDVNYRIVETVEELQPTLEDATGSAVFILDLMGPQYRPGEHPGVTAFDLLRKKGCSPGRIFLLTGFPEEAEKALRGRPYEGRLLIKPVGADAIVPCLMAAAGYPWPPVAAAGCAG